VRGQARRVKKAISRLEEADIIADFLVPSKRVWLEVNLSLYIVVDVARCACVGRYEVLHFLRRGHRLQYAERTAVVQAPLLATRTTQSAARAAQSYRR